MRKLTSLKSFLTDYFFYTKEERDGQILVAALMIFLFFLGIGIPYFYKSDSTDFSEYDTEVSQFIASLEAARSQPKSYNYSDTKDAKAFELFMFDPNTASIEDFQKLGLTEKVALSIERARSKNYHFYDKEDFKGFYGLKSRDYERLESYIEIAPKEFPKKDFDKKPKLKQPSSPITYFDFDPNTISESDLKKLGLNDLVVKSVLKFQANGWRYNTAEKFGKTYGLDPLVFQKLKPFIKIKPAPIAEKPTPKSYNYEDTKIFTAPAIIDINKSSVEDWERLPGIGPGYAKRIVKLRDNLGGFQNIAQVATTYKLPDSTFQKIESQLRSSPIFRKLKINQLSQAELMEHPYVSKRNAIALSGYVKFNGPIQNAQDLVALKIMTESEFQKLKPYIDLTTQNLE